MLKDLPRFSASVLEMDDILIRGYQFTVLRVKTVPSEALLLSLDRPCPFTAGESQPSPARLLQVVRARGYHTTLLSTILRLLQPARFVFKNSSRALDVAIQTCRRARSRPQISLHLLRVVAGRSLPCGSRHCHQALHG